MKLSSQLPEVDLADMAAWPLALKAACCAALAVLVVVLGYLLVLADSRRALAAAEHRQEQLRTEVERKTRLADRRPAAEARRQEAVATLAALLRRLPADTEVPALIEDVSKAASANGLTIESLALGEEVAADLYLTLPIALTVRGGFHQIQAFAAAVAALPRLVTLHDFRIEANDTPDDLTMTITAKTYRYTDNHLASEPPRPDPGTAVPD